MNKKKEDEEAATNVDYRLEAILEIRREAAQDPTNHAFWEVLIKNISNGNIKIYRRPTGELEYDFPRSE